MVVKVLKVPVHKVNKVVAVQLDLKVQLVHKVKQVHKVNQLQVQRVIKAQLVLKVLEELKVLERFRDDAFGAGTARGIAHAAAQLHELGVILTMASGLSESFAWSA